MSDVVEKMQRIIASDHCTADQMCGDCPCKETANRIFSEIMSPAIERLRAENEKLRAALKDCADDLEAEINAKYHDCNGKVHPALQRKYDNDMSTVRAAAAAIKESGNELLR